jgi:hypothetical protein
MKYYRVSCEVDEPVLLNCWKHHAGFIKYKIQEYRNIPGDNLGSLRGELLRIGESLMDLYLGELSPGEIAGAVITELNKQGITGRTGYQFWLKAEGSDYRIILLKDNSKWTLRLGEKPERYVHLHPSRYSERTIRVRSASLKSAILYKVLNRVSSESNLDHVNRIRSDFLELPPLKSLGAGSALLKLIEILS